MPFESEAQRRFMHAKHPKLAKEFEAATPDGANLPEKKLAEGGVMEDEKKPEEKTEGDPFLKEVSAGFKDELNHDSDAVKSYLKAIFGGMTEKQPEPMAKGGVPGVTFLENVPFPQVKETVHLEETPSPNEERAETGHEAHKLAHGGVAPHVTHMENTPLKEDAKVVHLANPPTPEPALPQATNPDQAKLDMIYKAMGMGKYAVGGMVPQPPTGPALNMPNPQAPDFWEQIKNALGRVAAPVTKPIGALADMSAAAAPAVERGLQHLAPPAVSAVNAVTGLDLPVPAAPPAPPQALGAPTDLSAPTTPTPPPTPPSISPVTPKTPKAAPAASGPDMKNLFNQDTSKLTEGVEASDRQAVVDASREAQGGLGSIIAQALAGFGDALAVKGGHKQTALKDVFTMQKQQRDEALANFDKGRQARLEKLDLQTKMGNNAIQQLAAQNAYGVDEQLNKQLGAPPGTKHADLPLYMQMAAAKAAQAEKDGDLYMRAHKQAADEIEAAVKNAGIFNIKPSPEQMKAQGAKLADKYFNRAKGNILFQPSDGQPPVWIPAKNVEAAKKMDPQGQIIP